MLSAAMIRPPSVAKRSAAVDAITASTTAYSGCCLPVDAANERRRAAGDAAHPFPPFLLTAHCGAAVTAVLRYPGRIDVT